jgi:tetratricopeptide (TPR) repeat protein
MPGFVVTARLAIKFGVVLALITTVWLPVRHLLAEVESDELEAFDLRGRQIELLYKSYTEILQSAFESLRKIVEAERPDLLSKLDKSKPERRDYGYLLIPKILPNLNAACADTSFVSEEKPYRPQSSRFSWVITEFRINRNKGFVVDGLNSKLLALAAISKLEAREQAIEKLVETYLKERKNHRSLDKLIQHNWLWQRDISLLKAEYDQLTLIHDAIVERTSLREALTADNDKDYEKALKKTPYAEAKFADPKTILAARVDQLNEQIHATYIMTPRDYIRLEKPQPHLWILHIPVNTDIEDDTFLQELKQEVEKRWCLRDGEDEYRVEIELKHLSTAALYGNNDDSPEPDKTKVPGKGEKINLVKHCRRFPKDAAKLSSGAKKTYIRAGCLFVGTADLGERTLSHEFGHLLGFGDQYIRGYRDLGTDGYEILEIQPDGKDIMSSEDGSGILRFHFKALVRGTYFRSALASFRAGDHEAAVIAYYKTLEIRGNFPTNALVYNNLGWSLKQLGKYQEAIAALEIAVKMRPDWSLARNNLRIARKNLKQQGEK